MPRTLVALALLILITAIASCGSGDGADTTARSAPTPVPPPAGWVTESGQGWSFVRPDGGERSQSDPPGEGEEVVGYQTPGYNSPTRVDVGSDLGIGAETNYPESLDTVVQAGSGILSARFPTFEMQDEGPVEIAGAEAYKIDFTYASFTEEQTPLRMISLYVQTPERKQINLFVRGTEENFERDGLERVIDSFRIIG